MHIAAVNSILLHYREDGDPAGLPVVFANSLGTDLRVWDALLPHLPEGLRLIRYDMRGHGLSDAPDGEYFMGDLVADAAGLIDHLGVTGAVFVGLSIGGVVAQGLAAERPGLLRAMVLANTAAKIGTEAIWGERIAAVRQGGIAALEAAILERWFSKAFRERRRVELAGWRHMLTRTPAQGYVGCCAAIAATDLRLSTAALRLPVLAIAGSEDGATPPDLVRETAATIPGARFELIRGAGHNPCVDSPEAMGRLIGISWRRTALSERYAEGMRLRREVLGDAHVDRAAAAVTGLDADFQTFITEGAWGSVWARPGFTLRERSIVTLALLAAMGADEELAMHVRATARTGAAPADVVEAMLHVAVYAGVPRANHALKIVKETYREMGEA